MKTLINISHIINQTKPLIMLFIQFLRKSLFSGEWKSSFVTAVYKRANMSNIETNRSISKLFNIPKLFELSLPTSALLHLYYWLTSLLIYHVNILNFSWSGIEENSFFSDVKNLAFDNANYELLVKKIQNPQLPELCYATIDDHYNSNTGSEC